MSQLAFDLTTPEPRMKTEPYRHQLQEYTDHYQDTERALIWQMRTGKSKVIIDEACRLFLEDKIDTLMIVAPNGVHENWIDNEVRKHIWDSVSHLTWYWDTSLKDNGEHIRKLLQLCSSRRTLRIAAFSSATLASQLLAKKYLVMVQAKSVKGVMLIFDEATDFRTPGSKRTKWARAFSKKPIVKYRRLLTGTPLLNSMLHGYSQLELLRPRFFGFNTFDDFKTRYAEYKVTRTNFQKLVGYKNVDEFKNQLATVSSFINREDCPDLTDLINITHNIELHPRQTKAIELYMSKARERVLDIPKDDTFAQIAELTKCFVKEQQIVSGFIGIKDEFDNTTYKQLIPHKENPKLKAITKEMRYTEEPIIIWCQFRYDIQLICKLAEALGLSYAHYYGKTSISEKRKIRQTFNEGKIRVLIGQPQSAGLGLDLSIASKIIWYSHTYNAIVRNQANERATDMKKASIELIDFVAPPIDRVILKALNLKASVAEYLADADPIEIMSEISLI